MKPILISCIPVLALAVFPSAAAELQMAVPDQAAAAVAPAPEMSIAEAEAKVKAALRNSREATANNIAVSSHASTLILTGTVGSAAEVAKIRMAAEAAAGSVRVSSQIEVDSGRNAAVTPKSSQLVRDVEDALRRDGATADLQLFVTLDEQQRILLSGLVPTDQARTAAQRVATSVPGVTRIENRLTIATK
jgi:osmotically-inducible protein OsmY